MAGLLAACGYQDGIVGAQALGEPAPHSGGFSEEFAQRSDAWETQAVVPDASVEVGQAGPTARDGYWAELRFPGHAEYSGRERVGADFATQLATRERFHFGTYRTRLSFGGCAPGQETVMAFLGYFNDGTDADGDGIVDDLEIDLQVACGAPSYLYLTVFTDDDAQGTRFRKLTHVVDFASGDTFETPSANSDDYAPAGNEAQLLAPELLEPDALYELGFEWHRDSIRFFLVMNGAEQSLWQLNGSARVPQLPLHIMYNLWHPDTHWYPADGAADFPANDVAMRVDWLSYEPE
ncbi:MAG TPA: glycoside hydrolase family 16 protein [Polyangiaceae bacterium]|nr:glycoside hydrolase family 16 protein [Polyangiaceae bacterium]